MAVNSLLIISLSLRLSSPREQPNGHATPRVRLVVADVQHLRLGQAAEHKGRGPTQTEHPDLQVQALASRHQHRRRQVDAVLQDPGPTIAESGDHVFGGRGQIDALATEAIDRLQHDFATIVSPVTQALSRQQFGAGHQLTDPRVVWQRPLGAPPEPSRGHHPVALSTGEVASQGAAHLRQLSLEGHSPVKDALSVDAVHVAVGQVVNADASEVAQHPEVGAEGLARRVDVDQIAVTSHLLEVVQVVAPAAVRQEGGESLQASHRGEQLAPPRNDTVEGAEALTLEQPRGHTAIRQGSDREVEAGQRRQLSQGVARAVDLRDPTSRLALIARSAHQFEVGLDVANQGRRHLSRDEDRGPRQRESDRLFGHLADVVSNLVDHIGRQGVSITQVRKHGSSSLFDGLRSRDVSRNGPCLNLQHSLRYQPASGDVTPSTHADR